MEKKSNDNEVKWARIDLMIQYLLGARSGLDADYLIEQFFKTPVTLSQKYDGTNVGKDEHGDCYGRNKMIGEKDASYQKTDLKCVRAIDAAKMKAAFVEECGIEAELVSKFVVYGELMCNPLYDYVKTKVDKSFQLFGAMIEPANAEAQNTIHEKAKAAGYTILKPPAPEDEDEDVGILLQVCFNSKYQKLAELFDYKTVPMVGEYPSFYEAVMANKDWMLEGLGEGLIVVAPDYIKKWKIGAEANASNKDLLDKTHFFLEDSGDKVGEHLEKFKEVIKILTDIQRSNKQLKFDPDEEYNIAIKSAMTKYDHHETFEYEEYLGLIVEETKKDIQVAAGKKH